MNGRSGASRRLRGLLYIVRWRVWCAWTERCWKCLLNPTHGLTDAEYDRSDGHA